MAQSPAKKEGDAKAANLVATARIPFALRTKNTQLILGPPDEKGNSPILAKVETDTTFGGFSFTGLGQAEIIQAKTPWVTSILASETPSPKAMVTAGFGFHRETEVLDVEAKRSGHVQTHFGFGGSFGAGFAGFAQVETALGDTKIIKPDGSTLMVIAGASSGFKHTTRFDAPHADTENIRRRETLFAVAGEAHFSLGGGSHISEGPFQFITGETPPQK